MNKTEPIITWTSLSKSEAILPTDLPAQPMREMPMPSAVNLRSEMEECDFGDEDMESEYGFGKFQANCFAERKMFNLFTLISMTVRMDAKTHSVTHIANFGPSNAILFNIDLRANSPTAFALRSDVDACIWLPNVQANQDGQINLHMRHEGTLNAFGYVQASKQQKKFLRCSPDMKYSIICEAHRHIFVYKANYDTATGLKNRNTSTKLSIGQQKLITMDKTDEVLGIVCENETTILLAQKQILCLQINS